ncbi:PREDICTED: putative E3 ubiquitin-protein ligase XBAT35 isoform X1 [Nicotiana attenuata]|uniref:E3 ubiquitin-protein ligase xbos34 n=1 Tax=Nicotiana attenuata TaxID=49451 RepID=A0A1J6IQF2_NICAT|nr:PREDICTED: putative E3 ubiquitin-protein ligase XBAT35 isoform X1 [Nicotiana attenuata]OIT06914.1 putative e3 ubiquitin-protein ligase xbos34 [Nicotiana attenuata]
MGQQQSKEELLYQQVIEGNIEAIKAIHNNGASLEWIDKEGKTPLIVACMKPNGLNVAKALVELGANVNAYRPGYHAGTALHHAAKRGLDDTVRLLLSYGANPLIKNDGCQTPLEVARAKGFSNVVRTIERQICIFSGWMREFYGPGFLEALAPQLLSRKIWVVVIPCGIADPTKPIKLELAIYSSLEDAQPRNVIALWKANVEEIRWQHSDPVLTIFDNTSNTRYKFTSMSDSEQQQLQLLHKACNAATEVLPPRLSQNSQTTVQQSETAAQAMELAIGINASIHSAKENKVLHRHGQSSGVKNENDWCNTTDDTAHNGWGSLVRAQPTSEITYHGWTDDHIKVQENGWGNTADVSSQRQHNALPRSTSTELSCSGWNDGPALEEYNGWAVPQPRPGHRDASAEVHYQGWGKTAKDSALPSISNTTSSGVSSCETMDKTNNAPEYTPINYLVENTETQEGNPTFDVVAPSAPPVPDEVVHEEAVHYPAIDLSPLNLSIPPGEQAASVTTERENKHEPALCIICWEASVEGACVPCGHMIGCMQCLNQINSKKGECPVCRVKIDHVIKLYSV